MEFFKTSLIDRIIYCYTITYNELEKYFSTKWRKVEESGFFGFKFTAVFKILLWHVLSENLNAKLTTRVG